MLLRVPPLHRGDGPDEWRAEPLNEGSGWLGTRARRYVHTVRGREAEAVIFVLGAPEAGQGGARSWAGKRSHLLSRAVARAEEVVYIVEISSYGAESVCSRLQ